MFVSITGMMVDIMKNRSARLLTPLLFLLLLAACAPPQKTALPTLAATAVIAQNSPVPPTATGSPLPTATAAETPEPNSTAAPTVLATATAVPTETPIPTITPTSLPQFDPVPLEDTALEEGRPTPATAIPSPVATFEVPLNTTNVLLLGNDGGVNTDTIMIVAINRTGPTASILSIPRDMYVYQPGKQMDRINTAVARGGIELLKQTILYNFGIPIHYYARVNFDGFKQIVDTLDGVNIAVSCELEDWRLKSPDLNPELEESWERFTLTPGVYNMDGDMALWYARSRLTTSDFDRGRRQQQLLRAILTQSVDLGIISEFPTLWNTYQEYVETDMDIGRILQLAALAPAIRENGVQSLYLTGKTQSWTTPEGANVQLPVWEGERKMQEEFGRLFRPPALNMAERAPIFVEVVNATDNPDLALLAADNLAWHGFLPVLSETPVTAVGATSLNYYKPNFKGSYDWLISWIFDMSREDINLVDDATFQYDYQVILGDDYNPCRPQMLAPQILLEN